jgi:hypothetical protein
MATTNHVSANHPSTTTSEPPLAGSGSRIWNAFAIRAFATIVARKHNIMVPLDDLQDLSDEELAGRLRLVSELAHLPPA